jgi:hypothetical protein
VGRWGAALKEKWPSAARIAGTHKNPKHLPTAEKSKMETQEKHIGGRAGRTCPHELTRDTGWDAHAGAPRLMRVSEVDRYFDPASSLGRTLQWVREFLVRPHPELGRPGPVCPFAPIALGRDTIWMAEIKDSSASFESIAAVINDYRDAFLAMEPTSGPEAINKTFLIVFSSLQAHGAEGAAVVDAVQASLKKHFVDVGLMLGEFHATNQSPGLRNPDFRPLRSPIPMLAIRHMVDSDLPFLNRESYSPKVRAVYLRSYLFRLGGTLSQTKFDEALNGLIAAEMALEANDAQESGDLAETLR